MAEITLAIAGASELDASLNTVVTHFKDTGGNDISGVNVYGQLGVSAMPYTADDDGDTGAEFLTITDMNIAFAARDTRVADVYGDLKPGDTVIHSTGPEHAARVFCKEESKEVTIMSKDSDGDDCYITINGSEDAIQATIAGYGFEMSAEAGIKMMTDKAYIEIDTDGRVTLNGSALQLGNTQLGNMLILSPTDLGLLNSWLTGVQTALTAFANAIPISMDGGAAIHTAFKTAFAAVTAPPAVLAATNVNG